MVLFSLFRMEFRRFFSPKNLLFILLIFALSFYFVFTGTNEYRRVLESSKEFGKCEALAASRIMNYTQFSIHGVKFMFLPSASSIFFSHPAGLSDVYARLNSAITLDINNNCKGKAIFSGYIIDPLKFSGIILLLGSLFALFWGYGALRSHEYMKFLSSIYSRRKLILALLFSRFLLLATAFLSITWIMAAFVVLNGIGLAPGDVNGLAAFSLSMTVMLLFFFLAGAAIGCWVIKRNGASALLAIWMTFVIFIPAIMYSLIDNSSSLYPYYRLELDKFNIVIDFEKWSEKVSGNFDRNNMNVERILIEEYWNNYYNKLSSMERQFFLQISHSIDRHKNVSGFEPASFYYLNSLELGSMGYEDFVDFYTYLLDRHREIVRFYIDRCFSSTAAPKVIPFIKGDENIFKSTGHAPQNFIKGIMVNLGYCVLLFIVTFLRFSKMVTPGLKNRNEDATINALTIEPGKFKAFLIKNFSVSIEFYNQILSEKGSVYICNPQWIPGDIHVRDFIRLIGRILRLSNAEPDAQKTLRKSFGRLNEMEKGETWIAVLSRIKRPVYLINDAESRMSMKYILRLSDWMLSLSKTGAFVVYLTTDDIHMDTGFIDANAFEELEMWEAFITKYKSVTRNSF